MCACVCVCACVLFYISLFAGKVEGGRECDRHQGAEHAHIHEQVRCDMFTWLCILNPPTPSPHRFQLRQIVGCYHSFKMREQTPYKNCWATYLRKRKNPDPFVKVKAEPVGRDPFTDITNTTGITNTTDITNTNGKEDQSTPRQPTGVEMVNNADADWWSELVTRFDCLLSQNTNRFDKIEAPISSLSTSGVPIAKQTKGEKNIIKV